MNNKLPDARPTEDKNADLVQRMFDRVAPKYDLGNTVLSAGSDRHWREVTVNALDIEPGMKILDVATGTAPLAIMLKRYGADVVGVDFSAEMLKVGARNVAKSGVGDIELMQGDGNNLPFGDNHFDALTIGFGLRNFPNPTRALSEFKRVVKPGGKIAVLEFSTPRNELFKTIYTDYLMKALPNIAKFITSDPKSYKYLAESILNWPDQKGLAQWFDDAGLEDIRWQNLTGGIVALHIGISPKEETAV